MCIRDRSQITPFIRVSFKIILVTHGKMQTKVLKKQQIKEEEQVHNSKIHNTLEIHATDNNT